MHTYLVRIGVHQAYGGWNASMHMSTNEFVYVPIAESRPMSPGLVTPFARLRGALAAFGARHPGVPPAYMTLP